MKSKLKNFIILLIFCVVIEVFVCNFRYFVTMHADNNQMTVQVLSGLTATDTNNVWESSPVTNAVVELNGVNGKVNYLHLDVKRTDSNNQEMATDIKVELIDEGNSDYYSAGTFSVCSYVPSSQYIFINSYGDVKSIKLTISTQKEQKIEFGEISTDAGFPFDFNVGRLLIIIFIALIIWIFRPGASLYRRKYLLNKSENHVEYNEQRIIVMVCLMVAIVIFVQLSLTNYSMISPPWYHHYQYHRLAVSFTEGRVDIDPWYDVDLSAVDNPYDTALRNKKFTNTPWDVAYFEGKYYVYFGVVPVLVFYLPYYLFTGDFFPTWLGVFLCSAITAAGIFYLIHNMVKKWFAGISLGAYILTSLTFIASVDIIQALMRPDFYYLPIIMALMFTIWGLGLWLSASMDDFSKSKSVYVKMGVGALFLALTAGCRPQFLIASFLIFPLFWNKIFENKKLKPAALKKFIPVVVPYVIVAAGIMYYNYIRFGSPFDFGANYNLTTNDMTHRGFYIRRLPVAIFMYLFQAPNIGMKYPFVFGTSFNSNYAGTTIRETMYGGAFFVSCFLLVLFSFKKVYGKLKEKKAASISVTCLVFALIVVVMDSQMAGILPRYLADFLWLLLIPAVLVFLQLLENSKNVGRRNSLIRLLLISFIVTLGFGFFMGIQQGIYSTNSTYLYYVIKGMF